MRYHEIEWTDDGQPVSSAFGDTFFSREDGQAETRHVFLAGNDLPQRWSGASEFVIGELGFGTGLNFLETWALWQQHRAPGQHLTFVSVEAFPMSKADMDTALEAWPELAVSAAVLLENWDAVRTSTQMMDEQTSLRVIEAPVAAALNEFPKPVDAWFLDGFAPSLNPDMWSEEVMALVTQRSKPNATFASYTCAGWVRRNLEAAGFDVEKLPGFGRKRDMIAGRLRTPE